MKIDMSSEMGCINSSNKQIFSLKRDNVFNVSVVRVQSEQSVMPSGDGVLELTPNEIIFIAPSRGQLAWGLQHLRRYGLTEDLFSFEAGRRCATGPGIYTFRCCNAEQLYSRFQLYINSMSHGTDNERTISSNHPINIFHRLNLNEQQQHANQYLEPSTSLFGAGVDQRPVLFGHNEANFSSPDILLRPSITSEISNPSDTSYTDVNSPDNAYNIYMDHPISATNERNNNSSSPVVHHIFNCVELAGTKMLKKVSFDNPPCESPPVLSPVVSESQRIYSNIDLVSPIPDSANRSSNSVNDSVDPAYVNIDVKVSDSIQHDIANQRIISFSSGNVVNYIVLDLDQPRSPSQCSPKTTFGSDQSLNEHQHTSAVLNEEEPLTNTSTLSCGSSTMPKKATLSELRSNFDTKIGTSGSYTRIDFLKTFALMKSTNYADFDPDPDQEESRITRHSKFVRKAYSISD
ncbi:uncharacterized protein LOC106091126 [Stomoxys calcitrans]|uniref:IRS-type PTB domain-containing protein n=1 Tax=Stomoxys calcitrans TaxID=35570 RepID=A0A1I8Q185_STOCA|nr:uncharacterized protein LOC106091126 [Stomoxys calcitrans]